MLLYINATLGPLSNVLDFSCCLDISIYLAVFKFPSLSRTYEAPIDFKSSLYFAANITITQLLFSDLRPTAAPSNCQTQSALKRRRCEGAKGTKNDPRSNIQYVIADIKLRKTRRVT